MASKRHSYGIVLHRKNKHGKTELFLCKANGIRYWSSTKSTIWGIPKGRPEPGETEMETAAREFEEETGNTAPDISYTKLIDFDTPHNKIITVFIGDASGIKGIKYRGSNILEVEYPEGSGIMVAYPEVSAAKWFTLSSAARVLMWGQSDLLDHIKNHIRTTEAKH